MRRIPGDELVKLTSYGPNAIVGEMSLLDRNRRSTHAVAVARRPRAISSARSGSRCCEPTPAGRVRGDELLPAARCCRAHKDDHAADSGSNRGRRRPAESDHERQQRAGRSRPRLRRSMKPCCRCCRSSGTFGSAELKEFLEPLKRYEFQRGQVVYAEGEAPRNCLIVVRGALSMKFSTPAGQPPCSRRTARARWWARSRSWTAVHSPWPAWHANPPSHSRSTASASGCCARADRWWRSSSSKPSRRALVGNAAEGGRPPGPDRAGAADRRPHRHLFAPISPTACGGVELDVPGPDVQG